MKKRGGTIKISMSRRKKFTNFFKIFEGPKRQEFNMIKNRGFISM